MALLAGCGVQKYRERNLLFEDWYVAKPLMAGTSSAAYGSIKNEGNALQILESVSFACAAAAAMHESQTRDNRVQMAELIHVTLAPGAHVVFEPGHKHIMLGNTHATIGERCAATFTFTSGAIAFEMPVRERK